MVKPEKFLSPEDRDRVRGAIEEAERLSAGEIRVLVVGRSASRSWFVGLLAGVATGVAAWAVQHAGSWGHPGAGEILIAVAIGLAAALVGAWFIPPSRASMDRAAWARAKREFARLGIGQTAGATGVLVMFSLYEHEAVVLADKAINEKVPPDTWSREVKILLDGVKAGRPADGIAAAVTEVGALLAKHFPRRDDDKNELSDDVVLR